MSGYDSSSYSGYYNSYDTFSTELAADWFSFGNFSGGNASSGGLCYDWVTYLSPTGKTYTVIDPMLVPLCLLALYIGVSRFFLMRKSSDTFFYSLTFLTYGVMMTNAMLADSLIRSPPFPKYFSHIFLLCDQSLTSSIACLLFWCSLSDLKWVNPKRFLTRLLVVLNIFGLFASWYYALFIIDSGKWSFYLYQGVVFVGCGGFCILQLIYLYKTKNFKSIIFLIQTGLIGGTGFLANVFSQHWCSIFGPHLNPSYWWFLMSDVAMLALYRYIKKSHDNNKDTKNNNSNKINNHNVQQQEIFISPVIYSVPQPQIYGNGYFLLQQKQ